MKCPAAQIFDDYLDDELNAAERLRFEEHLQDCGACRHRLEQERRFGELLSSQPLLRAPETFSENVLRHLQPRKQSDLLPDWLMALAWGLIATFGGMMVGKWGGPLLHSVNDRISAIHLPPDLFADLPRVIPAERIDWLTQLSSGSHLILLNFTIAGVVLCWGLWQMVKALR